MNRTSATSAPTNCCAAIRVRVEWRSLNRQGPDYDPFKEIVTLRFHGVVADWEIADKLRTKYEIVDSWEVLDEKADGFETELSTLIRKYVGDESRECMIHAMAKETQYLLELT